MARLTVLGSGTSSGTPLPGCRCATCTSSDPHDHRWRASVLLESGGTKVVIDATPEFRLQVLRAGVDHLDALLFTHEHTDHVAGLDDVRGFNFATRTAVPVYCDARTEAGLRRRFDYIFRGEYVGGGLPQLDLRRVDGPFPVGHLRFEPLTVFHGELPIVAYRCGKLAYVTDASRIPPETMDRLRDLDVLLLGAVRWTQPHPTHLTVEQALALIETLAPRRAWITHLSHDILHARDEPRLPDAVGFATDGLGIDFDA